MKIREQWRDLPQLATEDTCRGRTYIVTGANTGLGFECAQTLARLQAEKVILACRSTERGEAARTRMLEATGRAPSAIEVWQLDVGSYDSVMAFARRVETLERVDAVVENASVAMLEYQEAEGIECSLAINVVGTFLLAVLLVPHLCRYGKKYGFRPHLVIVGSEVAFDARGELERVKGNLIAGLSERAKTSMSKRYQTTKLLQFYGMRELASRLSKFDDNINVNIVNPGLCKTELSRNAGTLLQTAFTVIKFLLARTAEMGSRTLLHAVVAGPESHGAYCSACRVQDSDVPGWATDNGGRAMQHRVWTDVSGELEAIQPGCVQACLSD